MLKPWLKHMLAFHYQPEFELGEGEEESNTVYQNPDGREEGDRVAPNFAVFTPTAVLDENETNMNAAFHAPQNKDFSTRRIVMGRREGLLCFLEGVSDKQMINDMILRPLLGQRCTSLQDALERVLPVNAATIYTQGEMAVTEVLDGMTLLFLDGEASFLSIDTRKYDKRSVSQPQNEKTVRGAQQGFIEDLRTNINLLRNLVRVPELITTYHSVGGDNNLKCAMLYREGVAPKRLVVEITNRLKRIENAGGFMAGSVMLDELMKERKTSLFPQALHTERPDRTASFLTQGYIVIVAEGNPTAMVLPATFFAMMHTSEDSIINSHLTNLFRGLRFISILITMLLPGAYLAVMMYHSDIIPIEFLLSTLSLRQMIGMPIAVELLLMGVIFELVREASIRVQSGISQSLSIIGGLILGQAAISSNIVSPIVTIIVGLTGICSFAIPNYSLQLSFFVLRLAFLLLAGLGGFAGMTMGVLSLVAYLSQLTCYGVPFFAPFAPRMRANTDSFFKGNSVQTKDIPDFINAGDQSE